MDTIEALMHDRGNFPHGVYWCIREGSIPSRAVDRLTRFPNFHLVRIESFDSFFASLHDALGLSPHPIVDDPYRVVATRLSDLLNRLRVSSASQELPLPVERDIIRICQAMAKPNHESVQDMMPYKLLAYAEARRENYEKALEFIAKSIDESPEPDSFDLVFRILEEHWDQDKADYFVTKLESTKNSFLYAWPIQNFAVRLINAGGYREAARILRIVEKTVSHSIPLLQEYWLLNSAQIQVHLDEALDEPVQRRLSEVAESGASNLTRYGASCCLRDRERAVEMLRSGLLDGKVDDICLDEILKWPITRLVLSKNFGVRELLVKIMENDREADAGLKGQDRDVNPTKRRGKTTRSNGRIGKGATNGKTPPP